MSTISTPIRDTGETLSGSGVATLDPELQWVVPFDDVVAPAVRRLGGKGARLARLHALGLPVPGGFCIPAECLEAFAACNRLDLPNTLQRADPGELARIMALFRDEGVSIEYLYASLEHKADKAVIVLKVDDIQAGMAMLEKYGFATIPSF